jgi:HK97 family phage major capsid protein
MSSDVASYLALWGDAFGGQTVDLSGVPTTLRGRPLAIDSAMPSFTGTTGNANLLVVGDFSRFYIVERMGMSVELVPHLFSTTTNRPDGQRGIFAMARVGSDSIDDLSFRLLQNQA